LCAIAAVVGFLGYKLNVLITKSDTTKIKKGFFRDLDKGTPHNYSLGGTKFDFALKVDNPGKIPFGPEYGVLQAAQVIQWYDDDGSKCPPC
jgi:hypothetical protein